MKKISMIFFSFVLSCVGFGCFSQQGFYYAAPSLLPHTTREMKTSGYWVGRHPFPDQTIMTPQEIENFNKSIRDELHLTKDITLTPDAFFGQTLKEKFKNDLKSFRAKTLYLQDGQKASVPFFDEFKANMNINDIPDKIIPRFGFIVHYANHRIFPTDKALYARRGDVDFDELQDSDLDVGTPLVVLKESLDGRWVYVQTQLSDGWVKTEEVVFCSLQELKDFLHAAEFGVVIKPKADIFLDSVMTKFYDYVRMGVRLPILGQDEQKFYVKIPVRTAHETIFTTAYIYREDMREGYLPYTARNAINQAFKLLNTPYGWGGMYGEQDCSRFLQMVFATVGISLPRNSGQQALAGRLLARFDERSSDQDKLNVLKSASGGVTILPMKGHIMLYLGMVDERPYAIHEVWAYREPKGKVDRVRVINRVAVSDLSLGEGSKKGSLLQRINAARMIAP